MQRQSTWFAVVVWLCLFSCVAAQAVPSTLKSSPSPLSLRQRADRAFNEKSYAVALPLYRAARERKQIGAADRLEVDLRIAVCLGETHQFDSALATGRNVLAKSTQKARVMYWLGRLSYKLPGMGYRVAQRVYYGSDYPRQAGSERPEQVWLGNSNFKQAHAYLEQAKMAAQAERGKPHRAGQPQALGIAGEIDLNFDLAGAINGAMEEYIYDRWRAARAAGAPIPEEGMGDMRYNPKWWPAARVLFLYDDIARLDRSANRHKSALALLAKGLFISSYQQRMDTVAREFDKSLKRYVVRPYPFQKLDDQAAFATLVARYPRDPVADRALILIARRYATRRNLAAAVTTYRRLCTTYPHSKWVSDAQGAIQAIVRPELSLTAPATLPPGAPVPLSVDTRNVGRVEFAVYRVRLETVLTQPANMKAVNRSFTSFDNFGGFAGLNRHLGERLAKWTYLPQRGAAHMSSRGITKAPVEMVGACMVVASSGKLRVARLLVVSDLAIIKKMDDRRAFVYVADARTGRAVSGANVILRQHYNRDKLTVESHRGVSDAQGFFEVPRRRTYTQGVEAFAWVGDRYAMTSTRSRSMWRYYERTTGVSYTGYGYTERPVYRPGQVVHFRHVITRRHAGDAPVAAKGLRVRVQVFNPRDEAIYNKVHVTSEFGSLHGELSLAIGAPLGPYTVRAALPGEDGSEVYSFRVEEYKRPEFEVAVTTPVITDKNGKTIAARPGASFTARVNARYYFGAPVPGATVQYTVRRAYWIASHKFPTPYDWLWKHWEDDENGYSPTGYEEEWPVVSEGKVTTDASGYAELSFTAARDAVEASAPSDPDERASWLWRQQFYNPRYIIQAKVTDASRRSIEGQGEVRVARQDYFAFVQAPQSYYLQGDRARLEIATQDAADRPVATSGRMAVYRLLPGDREEKIHEEEVATDAEGRLFWTWTATAAGQFRVAWEGVDNGGKGVTGSTRMWVGGADLDTAPIRLRGVTILLDRQYYEEGQTLRALLVADKPGTSVLLTQEADGDILGREVVRIEGKSREISIPIRRNHTPNFVLAAALVKDYEVAQTTVEVFVPPVRSLLKVEVSASQAVYKPGESGTFDLRVTDWEGKPVRTEMSLALTDASLFYIQGDTAGDMRQVFYGEKRETDISLDSSRSGLPESGAADGNRYVNYQQHQWEMPDGIGLLNLVATDGLIDGGDGFVGLQRQRESYHLIAAIPDNDAPAPGGAPGYRSKGYAAAAATISVTADGPPGEKAAFARPAQALTGTMAATPRRNFAETAYWSPAVVTEGGKARVEVRFPDSLTRWHAAARGLSTTAEVGSGESDVETRKDLIVRLQAPRFFVQRDQVVLSANVHNYRPDTQDIDVWLTLPRHLKLDESTVANRTVRVGASAEQRVDWLCKVTESGQAAITMTARGTTETDAVENSFPVLVHGVQRFAARTGVLRSAAARQELTLDMPAARRLGASSLNVQINPSLAATMLDALPYLSDYPYGCVEQTMSRFLPTVVAARTLRANGVDLKTLRARAEAYAKEAQQPAVGSSMAATGYSYPQGMPGARDLDAMASHLWFDKRHGKNPIYSEKKTNTMIREGLGRIYAMQRPDGGWGWWQESASSDSYMSAYVLYGLATAEAAGIAVDKTTLRRGFHYAEACLRTEDNLDWQANLAYTCSLVPASMASTKHKETARKVAAGRLYEQRARLAPYGLALLAMTLDNCGEKTKAGVVLRNLQNTAVVDTASGTARWRRADDDWWCWWHNDVQTNATALRAFLSIDPKNRLTPMLMQWLVREARGNHWDSTRETAEVVFALGEYVRLNRELDVDYTVNVNLNGKLARTYRVTRDNALFFDNRFLAGDLFLQNGANRLTITKEGKGTLYWSAAHEYFSQEEPIKSSGHEIAIERRYFKLIPVPVGPRPKMAAGATVPNLPAPGLPPEVGAEVTYRRAELKDGGTLQSGEVVEVELLLNAVNDYDYLVFEDMKPAGLETLALRSGSAWGDGLCSNVELRDEKVAFFLDHLSQGRHVLRYRMRAEIPGKFHALPTNGYAMYAPEVRAISDERRLNVVDAPAAAP